MRRIIFVIFLVFVLTFVGFSQKKPQDSLITRSNKTKKKEADNGLSKIFQVLFYGLELREKRVETDSLKFSKSGEQDVLNFLKSFPVAYDEIVNNVSYEKKFRYIQVSYGKYFFVFNLGNETNEWRDRLYSIAFNITLPNKEIAEDETKVYEKLKQLYGEYTKTEKFRYSSEKKSNINLYIWEFPDITITYRSFYDVANRHTVMVVNYWDSQFYQTHSYYKL